MNTKASHDPCVFDDVVLGGKVQSQDMYFRSVVDCNILHLKYQRSTETILGTALYQKNAE